MFFSILLLMAAFNVYANDPAERPQHDAESLEGMNKLCSAMNKRIKKYYWGKIVCKPKTWHWDKKFKTPAGYPLVYRVFDDKDAGHKTTTMVLCTTHGDELTTAYQCFHLARDILFDNKKSYKGQTVIVVPLVNPDGFFKRRPTRQNGRGVDINRNFPTKDFDKLALKSWRKRYRSTPRKYPGPHGGSEIETRFQMMLIEKYNPDKIVSIHSPYGWLDFDSPSNNIWDEPDGYNFKFFKKQSKRVARAMSKNSNNYPLTSFQIFPGSLGNYAARERSIPVYTLELPTSGSEKAHRYWSWVKKGLRSAIQYELHAKVANTIHEKSDKKETN